MRRTMKHPNHEQDHYNGALAAARGALTRLAGNLKRFNEINLKEYTQIESAAGYARYAVRQCGSRPS